MAGHTDSPGAHPTEPSRKSVDTPPFECSYCGRPFTTGERLALHRGIEHAERLSDAEWEAYETATAAEAVDLRRYKLRSLIALAAVYFALLFAYAIFA